MNKSVKPSLASKRMYDSRNQKDYEKDIFMDFAIRIGIENFKIFQQNPPKPDIIIHIQMQNHVNEIQIGCEIKDLYWDKTKKGSIEKKRFENWKSFARIIRAELDNLNNGFEYLYGVVSLIDFDILNSKEDQKRLAKEFIEFLKDERLPLNKKYTEFVDQKVLSENVSDLRIETYAERGILWWETSLLTGMKNYNLDIFQNEIEQKNSKKYDFTNCDEKWLLFFAESNNLGNAISFPFEVIDKPSIKSAHMFDRVFYFDYFSQSIYQLWPDFKKMFGIEQGKNIRYIYSSSLPNWLNNQSNSS
ncbi:MAG: hypothetical protein IPO16_00990 [Saprospiraceae bacterium]|nr:hypothetical protein [Saprospiraceae bacterium]